MQNVKIMITPDDIQARVGDFFDSPSLVIEDKGIRLQSTLPVAVYAHSEATQARLANKILLKKISD